MEEKNLEEMEEEMVGVVVVGVLMVVGGLSQTQLRTTALAASERRLTSIVDESPEFFLNSRFYKLLKTNIYITAVLKTFSFFFPSSLSSSSTAKSWTPSIRPFCTEGRMMRIFVAVKMTKVEKKNSSDN